VHVFSKKFEVFSAEKVAGAAAVGASEAGDWLAVFRK
jgi:hypothetical protein